MDGALKKGAGLLVIVFLGFWLVQDPGGSAAATKQTVRGDLGPDGAALRALISFIKSIAT